jgi:hypothetical protein
VLKYRKTARRTAAAVRIPGGSRGWRRRREEPALKSAVAGKRLRQEHFPFTATINIWNKCNILKRKYLYFL